jgi:hypothetical protein
VCGAQAFIYFVPIIFPHKFCVFIAAADFYFISHARSLARADKITCKLNEYRVAAAAIMREISALSCAICYQSKRALKLLTCMHCC